MAVLLLQPTPSRIAFLVEFVLFLLAGTALWFSALPWQLKAALTAIILGMVVIKIRRAPNWAAPISRITLSQSRCLVKTDKQVFVLAPPSVTFYSALLIELLFDAADGQPMSARHKRLLLWPDSLTRDEDRRLRCYLQARRRA